MARMNAEIRSYFATPVVVATLADGAAALLALVGGIQQGEAVGQKQGRAETLGGAGGKQCHLAVFAGAELGCAECGFHR